jgi:hypothetical protein
MPNDIVTLGSTQVLVLDADGPSIGSEQDALDLMGEAYGSEVELIAIPVGRLSPEFLKLRTQVAGLFIQKLRNYRQRVAFVGDIAAEVAQSKALHDFVYESNKGRDVLFVPDLEALAARL